MRLRIAAPDEDAKEDARDVGVEDRGAFAEREAADRAGGVLADAFEGQERVAIGGQPAAIAFHGFARDGVQPAWADVVAKRPPRLRDVVFGGGGQRLERRVLAKPFVIFRQDAIDLRLLQHHFGDEDVIRVARPAPGKVAAVAVVPAKKRAAEALTRGGSRKLCG